MATDQAFVSTSKRDGDFIGLDVGLDVISYVHDELGDSYYTPPRLLKELVRTGRLGKKSGGGFYEYPEEP